MSQNYVYPPSGSGGSGSNASVSANGAAVPTSSTLIAGEGPTGLQTPVSVDASGDINVNIVGSSAGPTTVVQPTGSLLHTTVDASALPVGAATSANQTNGNQITQVSSLPSIPAGANTIGAVSNTAFGISGQLPAGSNAIGSVSVSNFPSTTTVTGTVAVVQPVANQLNATVVGTVIATQTVGSNLHVSVDNLPGTQPVSGTVAVSNFPTTQPVSGSVSATVSGAVSAATPTALTVHNAAVTVGTTAVRLTVTGSAPVSTRVVLVVTPDSADTGKFYIGASTVTSTGGTRGVQIVAGQTFIANNDAGDYWIISDTAAQVVEIMEQY